AAPAAPVLLRSRNAVEQGRPTTPQSRRRRRASSSVGASSESSFSPLRPARPVYMNDGGSAAVVPKRIGAGLDDEQKASSIHADFPADRGASTILPAKNDRPWETNNAEADPHPDRFWRPLARCRRSRRGGRAGQPGDRLLRTEIELVRVCRWP